MTKKVNLPKIETARLILRTYVPEDANALMEFWQDPDLSRYFPAKFRQRNQQEITEYVYRLDHLWQTRGFAQWGIADKTDGKLLGYCGFQVMNDSSEVEFYYGFGRGFWGRGLATEAACAAIRYIFEEINLARVVALTFPENTASQKVLEKLGFEFGDKRILHEMEVNYFELARPKYEQIRKTVAPHLLHYEMTAS